MGSHMAMGKKDDTPTKGENGSNGSTTREKAIATGHSVKRTTGSVYPCFPRFILICTLR
jgi:hypothetical protein